MTVAAYETRQSLDPTTKHSVSTRLIARSVLTDSPEWMPDPCLEWQGAVVSDGRGVIGVNGRNMNVPRAAWLSMVGPIGVDENGRTLDVHLLCHNKLCINPKHLELITHREAIQRQAARITHCTNGHEFTDENTYWRPARQWRRNINPVRICRTCARDKSRRYQARKRAEQAAAKEGQP